MGKARFLWVITLGYVAWSLVPVLIAIRISFNQGRSLVSFQGWSLTWWWKHPVLSAWARPELRSALFQSVKLAVITMVIAVPFGVMFAIAMDRWRGPLPSGAGFLMALSWITPELIIGVALLLTFIHLLSFVPLGTPAQVLGLVTFEMTYPVIIVRARLLVMGRDTEEAAMDLGSSPLQALGRVVVPQIFPAIIASMMIVFVDTIDDFVIAAWVSGPASSETVAIRIYSETRGAVTPALNALGSMMLLVSVVVLFAGGFAYRWMTRRRGQSLSAIEDLISSQA